MSATEQGGASVPEGEQTLEEILERYDSYIIMQVKERVSQNPGIARPAVLDLEIDELVQQVRIKFWHALEEKTILYPKAYIRRIVQSEFIDMMRRQKPLQMLSEDQEGEIYRGKVLVTLSEGMSDPAEIVEQREDVALRTDEVVGAVMKLSTRQQHVLICSLREHADDLPPLILAFKLRKADMSTWQWPREKAKKQLLLASLSYARRNLVRSMRDGLALQHLYLSPRKKSACCGVQDRR